MRFRTKLLSFLSVTMILVVFLCIFSANKAFKTLSFTNEQQLLSKHVSYLAEEIVSQKGVWSASSLGQYAQSHEVRITLMDRQGKVLYDSEQQVSLMDNHAFRLEVKQALANGIGFSDRLSNTSGLSMMYAAKLVDDTPYIVRVGERLSIIKEWQSSFGSLLLPLLVLVLIIVFFFSLLLVRNLTKPLEQMVLTAKEYGKGNLQEHSWVDKPEELATLSSTMDWMASELASQMEKLRTDKSQYSSILETMTEGVILIDIHKKVILANRASFAMTGSKEIGQSLLAFFSDNHLIELVDKTLEKGTVEQDILTRTSFQGETIFQITTAPIKKDHEEVTGAVITSSDITELKRLEQIRKDFVANVSHELKTPLTSILGFTEILCSAALSEEDRIHFAQIVQRNGKQMQNIISDLLTLSSLEKDNNIIPM
ncbi:MAG: histidine kinase dimerization/phospho-acceptor domain-containing protein, partial [Sphaerochaetaceae bacterium]